MKKSVIETSTYGFTSTMVLLASGFISIYKWGLNEAIFEFVDAPTFFGFIILLFLVIISTIGGVLFNLILLAPTAALARFLSSKDKLNIDHHISFEAFYRSNYTVATTVLLAVISFFLNEPVLFWLLREFGFQGSSDDFGY